MRWCIPCHCPDTVKHILLDCTDLCDTRIKYYGDINTMKKLFNKTMFNFVFFVVYCCFKTLTILVISYNIFWPLVNCINT